MQVFLYYYKKYEANYILIYKYYAEEIIFYRSYIQ